MDLGQHNMTEEEEDKELRSHDPLSSEEGSVMLPPPHLPPPLLPAFLLSPGSSPPAPALRT